MFIAREKELALINEILRKPSGSVMIYGKRKVGKARLITEALKSSEDKSIYYECIKSSIEDNIEGFVDVLIREKEQKLILLTMFMKQNIMLLRCRKVRCIRNPKR